MLGYAGGKAAVTHSCSVVPVTDRVAALAWFTAFFGRQADETMGAEALWRISGTAWIVIDEDAERTGHARLTPGVQGRDEILARLAAHALEHVPVETHGNGVRHVVVPDPDGNRLSLAAAT